MIISDIHTQLLSIPYEDPPKIGFIDIGNIDLLIVEIETSSGLVGMGFLHPLAGGLQTIEMCIHEMLKPLLIGKDATKVETLWKTMWDATFIQGRMGISVMAMSAIDIALWDLVGKNNNQPLWKLWQGTKAPLPVYGSGCYRGLGHDGMIEKAKKFVSEGYKAIKMQVAWGFTHDEDVTNVRDMRQELGDDIKIMIDVNQGWGVEEAIAFGKAIENYNVEWLEEPVMTDNFDGYHEIANSISTPLAGGENHFTHHDLMPFIKSGKVPTLQPDIMRGGYTELKVIAELSNKNNIKIAPHLFMELNTHLNASIPNASWLEHMGWYNHLWVNPILPKDGTAVPPNIPGHGMAFKPELFKEYPYKKI